MKTKGTLEQIVQLRMACIHLIVHNFMTHEHIQFVQVCSRHRIKK